MCACTSYIGVCEAYVCVSVWLSALEGANQLTGLAIVVNSFSQKWASLKLF